LLVVKEVSNHQLVFSGTLVGAGIGTMHYAGMQAMVMTPLLRYQPFWFALSIVVAVLLATLALWIGYSKLTKPLSALARLFISGSVMGCAIAGMHYTAMRAAVFIGTPVTAIPMAPEGTGEMSLAITLSTFLLGIAVLFVNLFVRYRDLVRQANEARAEMSVLVERLTASERLLEQRVEERTMALSSSNAAMQATTARLGALMQTIPDLFWMKDVNGVYQACNRVFERVFGAKEADIVGKTDYDLMDTAPADVNRANDRKAIEAGKPILYEEAVDFADDGHHVVLETIKAPIYDNAGQLMGVLGIARDITARKATEDEIRSLVFYDTLTGLPNRRHLMDRLQHTLAAGSRHLRQGALLFIDLDNFKTVNDTLGHNQGDVLLKRVAQRLTACIREEDTAARLGSDEFVVMLEDLSDSALDAATRAEIVGKKILAALNQPYVIEATEISCTGSIGITLFGGGQGEHVDEPLKRADLAMYQSKVAGRNAVRFFDPQMQAVVMARVALEAGLRAALQGDQLLLHYQAQVVEEGRIVGAEVLVRWLHPERGMVSPAEFIPLAEETGLILPLGLWVLETACRQLGAWAQVPEMEHLTVAVNVSARQFRQPEFVDQVLAVLQHTGANPKRLKLELTEGLLVHNVEDVIAKMRALKAQGVDFSLDDFGTGYSSLAYLKRLPLNQLKIDQGFVRDILTDSDDAAIAKTVISLAASMGLSVIAEGVETEAQRALLAAQGCHAYQGYLFSRPLPVDGFEAIVRRV
jgi:diguanylate cyclase (GGDEF)-like protein/PAS domain S-box-containing protein